MNSTANSGTGNQDQSAGVADDILDMALRPSGNFGQWSNAAGVSGIPMVLRSCVLGNHLLPCLTELGQSDLSAVRW